MVYRQLFCQLQSYKLQLLQPFCQLHKTISQGIKKLIEDASYDFLTNLEPGMVCRQLFCQLRKTISQGIKRLITTLQTATHTTMTATTAAITTTTTTAITTTLENRHVSGLTYLMQAISG